jgi:uncharacterized Fe-S cluster-containing radical SAM superfamily protein
MKDYPRYIGHPDFKPFNPLKLSEQTEKIVCRNDARRYSVIYHASITSIDGRKTVPYAEANSIGCNLRCFWCWTDYKRDFPEPIREPFLSPEDVIQYIKKGFRRQPKEYVVGITGGEITIGKSHLCSVLELLENEPNVLEVELYTNGILLGNDKGYVKDLASFPKCKFRIGLKAGTGRVFEKRCGAEGRFYDSTFKAIKYCLDEGKTPLIGAMTDLRITSRKQRKIMFEKCQKLGITPYEERVDPYFNALFRLEQAGFNVYFNSDELKKAQQRDVYAKTVF